MDLQITISQLPLSDEIKADATLTTELNQIIAKVCTLIKANFQRIEGNPPEPMKSDLETAAGIETAARFWIQNTPTQYTANRHLFFYDEDAYTLFSKYWDRSIGIRCDDYFNEIPGRMT